MSDKLVLLDSHNVENHVIAAVGFIRRKKLFTHKEYFMSLTNLEHAPTLHGHDVGCVRGKGVGLSPHSRLAWHRFHSLAKGPMNSVGSRLFSKDGSTRAYIL